MCKENEVFVSSLGKITQPRSVSDTDYTNKTLTATTKQAEFRLFHTKLLNHVTISAVFPICCLKTLLVTYQILGVTEFYDINLKTH
jgi:hypothetical protein